MTWQSGLSIGGGCFVAGWAWLFGQAPPMTDFPNGTALVGAAGLVTALGAFVKMLLDDMKVRRQEKREDKKLADQVAAITAEFTSFRSQRDADVKVLTESRDNLHGERDKLQAVILKDRLDRTRLEAEIAALRGALTLLGEEHTAAINTNSEGVAALATKAGSSDDIPRAPHLEAPTTGTTTTEAKP